MKDIYNNPNIMVRWVARKRINIICSMVDRFSNGYKNSYVLDVGCEDCYFFDNLQSSVKKVGIDFLMEPLLNAKKDYMLVEGDADTLPFKDKMFDITICSETLEHVLEPDTVMKEISRVTRNYIILSVPDDDVIQRAKKTVRIFNKKSLEGLAKTKVPEHINSWKSKEFVELVKQHFTILKVKFFADEDNHNCYM